jgi:DNA replication and repair protein RecF
VRRAAELLSRVPLVLFTPADLQLAQAAPVVRRRFMNLALARLRPAYADDLARYGRALMQRNRLLAMGAGETELRPWTAQMIAAGAEVAVARRRFTEEIGVLAAGVHASLAGESEKLGVDYSGNLTAEDAPAAAEQYAALLNRSMSEEARMRRTLVGPHRDDLRLTLGGQSLRRFGSQGQQRTAALALKLAEAELIKRETGAPPLLLLDDCLSELDEGRASHVLGLTESYGQLIVTSAAREAALERASAAMWLHLRGGEVERVE